MQLYLMVSAVQSGDVAPEVVAQQILQTVGCVEGWNDLTIFFKETVESQLENPGEVSD
jgi:hypothetical protein